MENGHDGVKNRQRHTEKSRLVQGLEALFKAAPEPPLAAGVSAALTQSKAAVQKIDLPAIWVVPRSFYSLRPLQDGGFLFFAFPCRLAVPKYR